MLLKEMSKEEVLNLLAPLLAGNKADQATSYLLDQILYCLERKVIKNIRNRQA